MLRNGGNDCPDHVMPYRGSHDLLDEAARRHDLGREQWLHARFADSEQNLMAALAVREQFLGPHHETTIDTVERIAALRHYQLRGDDAGPLFDRVLNARRTAHGEDHPATAIALRNRGAWLRDSSLPTAGRDLDHAVEILQRRLGADHPELAAALKAQAFFAVAGHDRWRALKLAERAHDATYRCHGDDHPFTAGSLLIVARAEAKAGGWRRARKQFSAVIAALNAAYGEQHPLVALATDGLGDVQFADGDLAGAAVSWERARATYARTYPRSPFGASLLIKLAQSALAADDTEQALAFIDEVCAIADAFPLAHRQLDGWLASVASVAAGRELIDTLRRVLDLADKYGGAEGEHQDTLVELRALLNELDAIRRLRGVTR